MSSPSAILALKARLQRFFTPFRQWPTDGTLSSFHRYTSHIRNIPLKKTYRIAYFPKHKFTDAKLTTFLHITNKSIKYMYIRRIQGRLNKITLI